MPPRRKRILIGVGVAAALLFLLRLYQGEDLERTVPARPGGELSVDLTLGSGFSFDKGSLTISSHPKNEVRVLVDTSGWGVYAVDVDVSEHAGGVRVVGRVRGLLHWMFGGPSVDLSVWVPADYSVDASIEDGPLLIEDVTGPIAAKIEGSELTLRRAEGRVRLVASGGQVRVEDVEGDLELESRGGDVSVSGVRGDLQVWTRDARIQIASVTGTVDVSSVGGDIEIDRVNGAVRARSERGGIEVEDVEGDLEVQTKRGRIEVEQLEGELLARSGRGGIEVEFVSSPAGLIETERGSIRVEVPFDAGFHLDAQTARGNVELDSDLGFVEDPEPSSASESARNAANAGVELGQRIAHEVTTHVHDMIERGLRDGDWSWDWQFELPPPESGEPSTALQLPAGGDSQRGDEVERHRGPWGRWRQERQGQRGWGEWGDWGNWGNWGEWDSEHHGWRERSFGRRSVRISGDVNGGGESLRVRTERGSIQIDDR